MNIQVNYQRLYMNSTINFILKKMEAALNKMSINQINVRYILTALLLLFMLSSEIQLYAQNVSNHSVKDFNSKKILSIMERAADWQIANQNNSVLTDWTQGAYDAGVMALAGISGNSKYLDVMKEMGEKNQWQLGKRMYMADDQCIGQTYAELYLRFRENKMIEPIRQRFDEVISNPPDAKSLDFNQPGNKKLDLWSWCDALFMSPPAFVRLYAATGNKQYLEYAVKNWWRTTDYLYDKKEHLFFRDSRYFDKREANGEKVFWSRGNGWVMAGLVRMLQYMPTNYPERPRFEKLFRDMARRVVELQQPDSLWHASLLDPKDYPEKETSGSGLITYALAWGINQGILSKRQFEPAVLKAWTAIVNCIEPDGKLTHVQPIGFDPKKFDPNSNEAYGTGAFLLAGSEVYRMAVIENTKSVKVNITNPAGFYRDCETVELNLTKIASELHMNPASGKFAVMDGISSRILDSQTYASKSGIQPDKFLFQVDLSPKETKSFYIIDANKLAAIPKPIIKTYVRYNPNRYDDFAWESDRIAFRAYGQKLMTAPGGEALTSSGIDVWIKSNRNLIIDKLYETGNYHNDNGTAMDDYKVGTSRGDGGLGILDGKRLWVSRNYFSWKTITTGPIRSVFELAYKSWDAGSGRTVSEVKRITVDAGSWLCKNESIFGSNEKAPLTIGVGLAERSCGSEGHEEIGTNKKEGWMTYWQPEDKPKGRIGTAVLLPRGSVIEFTNDNPGLPDSIIHAVVPQPIVEGAPAIRSLLAITKVKVEKPFTYYFGACWDRSNDFTTAAQWENYISRFAARRDEPLKIKIEK